MAKSKVAEPSRESMRDDPTLAKVRTLRAGVGAMREAGEVYLPKEERETDEGYKNRKNRSILFTGLDQTIEDTADRIFAKDVTLGEDVPAEMVDIEDDITNDVRNLNNFARELLEDGIEAGISFIYVDSPKPLKTDDENGVMTIAQQRATNFRPYMVMIKAENILGWQTTAVNNITQLSQVRIMEAAVEPDPENPYEQLSVPQVRVLTLDGVVGVEIFRENDKHDWVLHDAFQTIMTEITVVPFYANRTGFFTGEPVYKHLADMNVAHWQMSSGYDAALHKSFVPVPVFTGFGIKEFTASPNMAMVTENENAKAMYLELKGTSMPMGRARIKDLELAMQLLGLELILPKTGNTTATGEAIDAAKAKTPLAQMSANLKEALDAALGYMAEYMGIKEGGGTVNVNTDFGMPGLGNIDLTTLTAAANTGLISQETYLKELMRRNLLSDDIDVEAEIERTKEDTPAGLDVLGLDDDEPETVNLGEEFLKVIDGGK